MTRIYELYLADILQAIDRIRQYTYNVDETSFKADTMRVDSVLFNLMTIGEAVKNIPEETKQKIPEVRWRDIGRFRDRVVHHYFGIDLDVVWEVVAVHLPVLYEHAEQLLKELKEADDNKDQA